MFEDDKHASVFPKKFLWGASTAAHQVEGGTYNQWSVWELAHADELAKTAHRRLGWLANWDAIKPQAEDPANYVSGRGVDHYRRFEADFDLAKSLHLNALRFSVEWSRIEPEQGVWDEAALDHYRRYIAGLRQRKIEPVLNIWHWTLPVWFAEKGGFKQRRNRPYFERFVAKLAEEYAGELHYVITINEPNVYASFSYATGEWPPQEKSTLSMLRVYWNLAAAHRSAYKILKRHNPRLQIGVAAQLANIQAKRPHNLVDEFVTQWMRYAWNWWFLNRIRRQQDFIGFNYYFGDYYKGFKRANPPTPVNDLGWYMEPEGLYPLLVRVWAHYQKPILITENGVADADDRYRQWWLEETVIAMEKALSEGIDLRGYFHWSLLDNFEWAYGWWPKFGLAEVQRGQGMKRVVRPSAKWLSAKIRELS